MKIELFTLKIIYIVYILLCYLCGNKIEVKQLKYIKKRVYFSIFTQLEPPIRAPWIIKPFIPNLVIKLDPGLDKPLR